LRLSSLAIGKKEWMDNMVEVFKTNVQEKRQGKMLLSVLSQTFPSLKINFDLSDCDKVLRVEGDTMETKRIMMLLQEHGFTCEVLN
jgi:tRNA G26 N,N-dimethylase Trm1